MEEIITTVNIKFQLHVIVILKQVFIIFFKHEHIWIIRNKARSFQYCYIVQENILINIHIVYKFNILLHRAK